MLNRSLNDVPVYLLLFILVVVFFVCRAGALPLLSNYHGDESWYTDAAIQMIQSGDYTTPRYADGTLRFRKPILSYWILVASYKILGISLFSSRLPFLLAACMLIVVTFLMSLSILGNPKAALLAAAMIASNVEIMDWSALSHPDIYQVLFLTICLWGMAHLLLKQHHATFSHALIYLGAGLAAATKGLLGIAALAYGAVFFWLQRNRKLAEVFSLKWALLGAALPFVWFASALHQHGTVVVLDFFSDQAGEKISTDFMHILWNSAIYFTGPVRWFFPWSLFALVALFVGGSFLWKSFRADDQDRAKFLSFAFWWFILMVLVFSMGKPTKARYLLPTYPLIACVLASFLSAVEYHERPSAFIVRLGKGLLIAGAAIGGITAAVGVGIDYPIVLSGLTILIVASGLLLLCRHQRVFGVCLILALFFTATYSVYDSCIHPLFRFSPAPHMSRQLADIMPNGGTVATIGIQRKFVGQLAVMLEGRFKFQRFDTYPGHENIRVFPVSLVSEHDVAPFDRRIFSVEECGQSSINLSTEQLWNAIRSGRLKTVLSQSVQRYYIVQPIPGETRLSGSLPTTNAMPDRRYDRHRPDDGI